METITPARSFPVSLAEAKHQLGFFHSEDDQQINGLIAVATAEAEEYTGVTPIFTQKKETREEFPQWYMTITGLPFAKLHKVEYYDTTNTLQTLAVDQYRLYTHKLYAQLEPVVDWPETFDREDAVQITYTCGHAMVATADQANNTIIADDHPFANGDRVILYTADEASLPAELAERKVYHVVNAAAGTVQLSLTAGGSAISITNNGAGQFYLAKSEVPRPMKQAILMMLTGLNEFRADQITGTIATKVALNSRYLLDHVKPRRL